MKVENNSFIPKKVVESMVHWEKQWKTLNRKKSIQFVQLHLPGSLQSLIYTTDSFPEAHLLFTVSPPWLQTLMGKVV